MLMVDAGVRGAVFGIDGGWKRVSQGGNGYPCAATTRHVPMARKRTVVIHKMRTWSRDSKRRLSICTILRGVDARLEKAAMGHCNKHPRK